MLYNPAAMSGTCPCCGSPVDPEDLVIDHHGSAISYKGKTARITRGEMAYFMELLRSYPDVATKDQLMDAIAPGSNNPPQRKILDVYACKLRKHTDPLGLVITTVWGVGYRLEIYDPSEAQQVKLERFLTSRRVRTAPDDGDYATIRMLRDKGFSATDIAQRIGLTINGVGAVLEHIGKVDNRRRETAAA